MTFLNRHAIQAFVAVNLIFATACTDGSKQASQDDIHTSEVPVIDTLLISSDYGNLEQADFNASNTDFVILQEDDRTMFSDISQVIDAFGKYFIVDSDGSRKVVSFDHNGKPLASYGKRGKGPDEYIFPWDVNVTADYVYILDISQQKLIKYNHAGNYISNQKVPFGSRGFTFLNDHKILFNLDPMEEGNYQLCVTDSALNPLSYMLHYPDGHVGGWITNDVFLKNENGISYYKSPADTIYRLDNDGRLIGKRLLEFENGPIHESAKIDFVKALEQEKLTSGMHLLNNPFELPNGICFMEVTDYTKGGAHVVALDPASGKHRAKKFGDKMSIYDVIVPCALDRNNHIISYLDRDIASKCDDFAAMPDSLVKALDKGYRLLVIHRMD